ncbi:MAG TPA: sigma-70 family RNA polymerase sigma factor [Terriglobia bacterium]|nr:sigma-70 family RNA polymerase sigma factor [Terriglobia bacterium]
MHELTLTAIEAAAEAETAFHMDEDRFRLFHERTARKLWGYLARIAGDPALADDLLQETYYRFLRARLAEDDEAYLRNYLFRIATNLVRDHWRQQKNQRSLVQPLRDDTESPVDDRTAERVQQQSDLDRALNRMKPREREMLWLAYAMGSNHKEIAGVLGMKAESIRLSLFRARRKLVALLGGSKARLRE